MEGESGAPPSPWEVRLNVLTTAIEAPPAPARLHGVLNLRVREDLKRQDPEAYTPVCLFLGFLSRPDPHQQLGLDALKVPWARQFLAWKEMEWKEFVQGLEIDVEQAHAMYDLEPGLAAEVVTNVLALDALFLSLLLLKRFGYNGRSFPKFFGQGKVVQLEQCGAGATWTHIHRDVFLMENQLPLYILHRVFRTADLPPSLFYANITRFIQVRYSNLFPDAFQKSKVVDDVIARHVLVVDEFTGYLVQLEDPGNDHLLYYFLKLVCYVPSKHPKFRKLSRGHSLSSASLLHRHGIRFKSAKGTDDPPIFIHQIRFEESGSRLLLPSITIYNHTEVFWRNLAACEQKNMTWRSLTPLASYLSLMDDLINTIEDVQLLTKFKVIRSNTLGSDSDASEMWNKLAINLVFKQSVFFKEVIEAVNAREKSSPHKLWAEFKAIYFSRPWYTVSFFAAFVLLGLTVAQTVYAILAFNKQ